MKKVAIQLIGLIILSVLLIFCLNKFTGTNKSPDGQLSQQEEPTTTEEPPKTDEAKEVSDFDEETPAFESPGSLEQVEPNNMSRAKEIIDSMSKREKICQLMIVRPDSLTGVVGEKNDSQALRNGFEKYPVSGIIFFADNIESREQTSTLISVCQEYSKTKLFVSVDEEGGTVARVAPALGTTKFDSMYEYRNEGTEVSYNNAGTIGKDIKELGFNMVFAPVADVWTNSENTVIGKRAYSDDPDQAAELVSSAVKGFQDAGVIATLKHFPGHGDTSEDSHFTSAYSKKTLDELRNCEFKPFRAGIDAGVGAVMTSHVTLSEIDPDAPTTISPTVVSGLLRDDLGFDGVVVTDALEMQAMEGYTPAEVGAKAILAGTDLLLGVVSMDETIEAIDNEVSEERIDKSLERILSLKLEFGIVD